MKCCGSVSCGVDEHRVDWSFEGLAACDVGERPQDQAGLAGSGLAIDVQALWWRGGGERVDDLGLGPVSAPESAELVRWHIVAHEVCLRGD
jgi:hypothetical protein